MTVEPGKRNRLFCLLWWGNVGRDEGGARNAPDEGPGSRRRAEDEGRIEWAQDASSTSIEHVGVDHGRADVRVAEQLLDGAEVVARLQQMRREGMPKSVTGRGLRDAGSANRGVERTLQDRLVGCGGGICGR